MRSAPGVTGPGSPRDPAFATHGRLGFWTSTRGAGRDWPWDPRDYALGADEKTSIQVRRRRRPSHPAPAGSGRSSTNTSAGAPGPISPPGTGPRAKGFGRGEPQPGIAPFDRLVAQVRRHEPSHSTRRVF